MQPPTGPPRDNLTTDQIVALIQDSSDLTVGCGCELLDMSLNVVEDITPDFVGGSVSRSSYATLHGTANLAISRELDWGRAIIRPFITLSAILSAATVTTGAGTYPGEYTSLYDDGSDSVTQSQVVTARFNLGAYYTSTPARQLEEEPVTYDVQCYDILSVLDDAVGDVYAVAAGTGYLAAVAAILSARGVTAYVIDQTSAATVLPTDRVWIFDDKTTWLLIVNDLLGSIGYQGIWSDWDGRLRCQPYETPRERPPEWTYTDDAVAGMLNPERSIERDYYTAPNRWIFYRSNNVDGPAPEEGNGIYTYTNNTIGDTSVEARGRTITRAPVGLDVADHASLVAKAQQSIDADMQVPTKITVKTAPMPLHWHFDRCYVTDSKAGVPMDIIATQWTLPLDGGDMSHEWTVLA
jgi:hypothetical protein